MPSVNNVWASNAPTGVTEEVTTPSGQTCLARRLGIEGLIEAGILMETDSLSALVDRKHIRRVRGAKGRADGDEVDMKSVLGDSNALKAIITIADKALPAIVENPPVALHYTNVGQPDQRMLTRIERAKLSKERPGVVFTDQIGFEDKMFLFEWAIGNMAGMFSFRERPSDAVESVADVPVVPKSAQRATRNKK